MCILALIGNDLIIFPPENVSLHNLHDRLKGAGWRGRTVVDNRRKCLRVQPIEYPQVRELLAR